MITKEKLKTYTKGRFELDILGGSLIKEYFNYYEDEDNLRNISWLVNKNLWFCHNCGCAGFKYNNVSSLSKCYMCKSVNITIIKSGEVSIILRQLNAGVNMLSVREIREEQIKQAKLLLRFKKTEEIGI